MDLGKDDVFIKAMAKSRKCDEKTINGIDGYIGEDGSNLPIFMYIQLKRFVLITSTKKEYFDDVVMKNDDADIENLPPVEYKTGLSVGKLIWGIIGLGITLLLMYGASTGALVLRGTNSSEALFYFCFIFLAADLYYIYKAITG